MWYNLTNIDENMRRKLILERNLYKARRKGRPFLLAFADAKQMEKPGIGSLTNENKNWKGTATHRSDWRRLLKKLRLISNCSANYDNNINFLFYFFFLMIKNIKT